MYNFISHVNPCFTQQVTTEVADWHALLGWRKIGSYSLACELSFKIRDLVTTSQKLSLFKCWFWFGKKSTFCLMFFWTNQSMSFGDLNCEKHIVICLKYVGIVAWICQGTVNSQSIYYHLLWHMTSQSYHGFRLHLF